MNSKHSRKKLHSKCWGNWRYDANDNALYWDKDYPYCVLDFDTVDKALQKLSDMHTKKWITEQDMKDLAEALSDLNECPGLASSYDAYHYTISEAKRKVLINSGSSCENCADRFRCYTT
jgi:hypothetical protein